MKLGKKLEVTDIKERLKLLIDGEVFYTKEGNKIEYMHERFTKGDSPFTVSIGCAPEPLKGIVHVDWYYPAKTYTINGVELVDERVLVDELFKGPYFVPNLINRDMFVESNKPGFDPMIAFSRGLVFRTKEAAIAHAKAMIQVTENNQ